MPTFNFSRIDDPATAGRTYVEDVNSSGVVAGYYVLAAYQGYHGFIYSGGIYNTLDVPFSVEGTDLLGINDLGQITGQYDTWDGRSHGFTYSGGVYSYIDEPTTDSHTVTTGINNLGEVVGNFTRDGRWHGFSYIDGTYTAIDVPGSSNTFAEDINDAGQIVGHYDDLSGTDNQTHSFVYDHGSFTVLPDDPLASYGTFAEDINNHGQIVGSYVDSNSMTRGFVYSHDTYSTITDVPYTSVRVPTYATAINDAGQIAGIYFAGGGGDVHGFLATPVATPDPSLFSTVNLAQSSLYAEMARLSAEVYGQFPALKHPIELLATEPFDETAAAVGRFAASRGWHEMTASELGIASSDSVDSTLRYAFIDGAYQAIGPTGVPHIPRLAETEANALVLTGLVDNKRTLAVIFRGTDERSDWADYPSFLLDHYPKFAPLVAKLKQFLASTPVDQVLIDGHSLGGGVAQLFAQDIQAVNSNVELFTFGSPGAEQLSSVAQVNFLHNADPVATLFSQVSRTDNLPGLATHLVLEAGLAALLSPAVGPLAATSVSKSLLDQIKGKLRSGTDVIIGSDIPSQGLNLFDQHSTGFVRSIDAIFNLPSETFEPGYVRDIEKLVAFARDSASPFSKSALARAIASDAIYNGAFPRISIGNSSLAGGLMSTDTGDDFALGDIAMANKITWKGAATVGHPRVIDGGGTGVGNDLVLPSGRSFWDIRPAGDHYEVYSSQFGRVVSSWQDAASLYRIDRVEFAGIWNADGTSKSVQLSWPMGPVAEGHSDARTDPMFDSSFYLLQNPDVAAAGLDPLFHYSRYGALEGRNPDAFFNTRYYLNQNPDVAAAGADPLTHYEASGWREGRDPSAAFSINAYLAANPDVKAAGIDPVLHFLTYGEDEGRTALPGMPHSLGPQDPLVDPGYYYQWNLDVKEAGADAVAHFLANGWREGRNPDAYFDTSYYLAHNADVAAAGINPLQHYDQFGWKEGRDASAQFSTDKYLAAYGDVRAAGIDPLLHYIVNGQAEGRTAFNV